MNVNNCENKCYWLWKWRLKEWQRRTVRLKLMALKGNWTVMRVKTKHCKSENEELDEWKGRNERVVVTLESYWVLVPRKSARAWVKLERFFAETSVTATEMRRKNLPDRKMSRFLARKNPRRIVTKNIFLFPQRMPKETYKDECLSLIK